MRSFVYLVAGFVAVLVVGVFVLLSVLGGSLWIASVLFLTLAAFLFFWDFERDAVFKDDWVEAAQVTASLVCGVAGLAFLAAYVVA
jgi:hypothetical protein